MRLILICLTALLMMIQFPLWLGKGGWLHVWDLDKQVMAAQHRNDELKARNAKLSSEVQDLKQGTGAVEERARFELGMIKDDEIFVQVLDPNAKLVPADAGGALRRAGATSPAPAADAQPSSVEAPLMPPAADAEARSAVRPSARAPARDAASPARATGH